MRLLTCGSHINVAFSRGTGWRGLCSAQTVTDRTVGYNAWLCVLQFVHPHFRLNTAIQFVFLDFYVVTCLEIKPEPL